MWIWIQKSTLESKVKNYSFKYNQFQRQNQFKSKTTKYIIINSTSTKLSSVPLELESNIHLDSLKKEIFTIIGTGSDDHSSIDWDNALARSNFEHLIYSLWILTGNYLKKKRRKKQ